MSIQDENRHLAKCNNFELVFERDHNCLAVAGEFNYGWSQGLGYAVDTDFIKQFMNVFRIDRVSDASGRSCWITKRDHHGPIIKIEPLHPDDGEPFDIAAWTERKQAERNYRKKGFFLSARESRIMAEAVKALSLDIRDGNPISHAKTCECTFCQAVSLAQSISLQVLNATEQEI